MNAQTQPADSLRGPLLAALASLNQVLLGKDREVRLALACLLARGHLLIEDIPGVGKTTLAHALSRVLGLSYQRIQFTSDLLPADVTTCEVGDWARYEQVRRVALDRFGSTRNPIVAEQILKACTLRPAAPATRARPRSPTTRWSA